MFLVNSFVQNLWDGGFFLPKRSGRDRGFEKVNLLRNEVINRFTTGYPEIADAAEMAVWRLFLLLVGLACFLKIREGKGHRPIQERRTGHGDL